jgi:hypothetical protein
MWLFPAEIKRRKAHELSQLPIHLPEVREASQRPTTFSLLSVARHSRKITPRSQIPCALPMDKATAILKLMVEGMSIRSVWPMAESLHSV